MENNEETRGEKRTQILLSVFFIVISLLAIYFSKNWRAESNRFPLIASITLFICASLDLLLVLFGPKIKKDTAIDFETIKGVDPSVAFRRTIEIFGWIVGCGLLVIFLGFTVGLSLFVFLYVKVVGRYGWLFSLLMGAITLSFLYGLFVYLLNLPFPEGLLSQWLGLDINI